VDIDWSNFTFSEDTCHCRCHCIFRSHAKYVLKLGLITRNKCPKCGKNDNCWRITSDIDHVEIFANNKKGEE